MFIDASIAVTTITRMDNKSRKHMAIATAGSTEAGAVAVLTGAHLFIDNARLRSRPCVVPTMAYATEICPSAERLLGDTFGGDDPTYWCRFGRCRRAIVYRTKSCAVRTTMPITFKTIEMPSCIGALPCLLQEP